MNNVRISLLFTFMIAFTGTSFAGQGADKGSAEPECDYITVPDTLYLTLCLVELRRWLRPPFLIAIMHYLTRVDAGCVSLLLVPGAIATLLALSLFSTVPAHWGIHVLDGC